MSYRKNDRYATWKFLIKKSSEVTKALILMAPYYTYGSGLLENNILIFLFDKNILTVNLNDLEFEVNKPFSDFGIFFSVDNVVGNRIHLNCWYGFSVTLDKNGREV